MVFSISFMLFHDKAFTPNVLEHPGEKAIFISSICINLSETIGENIERNTALHMKKLMLHITNLTNPLNSKENKIPKTTTIE
ncbi:hypothetical protein [Leptospira sarikeiensis]|uniref:Uncharacterized protein n=1 Tax=Leptospira sarikeiensis TaxID=2484943 RepID=A0A4R9KB39_9LEPT|nr:hypothetical protein [Leptospira sarikeiensis]TGL62023.1 hypothetical protein EHQ64_09150 [Leptospira sarikeiensis]